MAKGPATIVKAWALRQPIEPDASAEKVAYWTEWARRDPWTWDDLMRMIDSALADDRVDDLSPALIRWGLERHARPRQHGPARDPKRDIAIFLMVECMIASGEASGVTDAYDRLGRALNKSAKTIETARARALSL